MENTFNIGKDQNDRYYRYKCQKPIVSHDKSKNYTFVENLAEIAKTLNIQPEYIAIYLNIQAKSFCKYNEKKDFLIKKDLSYEQVLKLLMDFIKLYVACPKCSYPELNYEIEKEKVTFVCRSCDYQKEKEKDKIIEQMIKNPPKKKEKKNTSCLKIGNQELLFPEQIDF